ncbi:hypothetical protein AMAG_03048 [Allomyces macrogynus ATCC 38327]|uniref:SET domain-containing protein n=1 Tax=Allomyces macrogynus (strain ATCC 38327) TaxID=578462 RepID=A0A0L0S4I7_ALLM3|nr:hypothetical protein AMAG_03048 [Allomyces macrogynus ATCC 38327]|eukprot:KNE57326.1 hypothetical protein AMAG_03048 [Allomyces macrogynus ATCC 38327]
MSMPAADAYKPSHPDRFKVVFGKEDFSSKLVATRAFAKGEVIAKVDTAGAVAESEKRYSTIQVGKDKHAQVTSDLVYMNHSCNPSADFDAPNMALIATQDIAVGDDLSFFYPSSEWDMDQPFDCWCGASQCIMRVEGAKHVPADVLNRYSLTPHIQELKAEQEAEHHK